MKLFKSHPLLSLLNSYLIDSPQPVNISYLKNFGFILGVCLIIQIISGIASMSSNLDLTLETTGLSNTVEFFKGPFILSSLKVKYHHYKLKYNGIKSSISKYLSSFDFVKGVILGLNEPTLPLKLATYHNSPLGRILRVIGGICAYTVLVLLHKVEPKSNIFSETGLSYIYYVIVGLALCHLSYMILIFFTRFLYTMYHIITGKWIHRNSPLKYFLTEGHGVWFCVRGVCYLGGTYVTIATAAATLDHALGEDYFRELAIIKNPAIGIKNVTELINNNITFGPSFQKTNSEADTSKVLTAVRDREALIQFKYKLTNDPEIMKAFEDIKRELNQDIIEHVDKEITRLLTK